MNKKIMVMGHRNDKEDELSRNCRYYSRRYNRENIKNTDLESFYGLIKELFYDHHQYKWRISKGLDYIINQRLDATDFTEYLKDFREEYIVQSGSTVKLIGLQKFIENIANNQKIKNRRSGKRNFISLNSDANIDEFFKDVYNLRGHLNTTHADLIEVIYDNISIPYSKNTFTRLFYDGWKKYKKDKKIR